MGKGDGARRQLVHRAKAQLRDGRAELIGHGRGSGAALSPGFTSRFALKRPGPMRAVDRLTVLLKLVAAHAPAGLTLAELSHHSGLDKATVLRLTHALCDAGWLVPGGQRRFTLGVEAWLAGRNASPTFDRMVSAAQRHLKALARGTEATAYRALHSGTEMVFLVRADAGPPLRARIEVGQRQTVVVGATGLAWLAALPSDESDALIHRLQLKLKALTIEPDALLKSVARARTLGHAVSRGSVFYGVPALGIAIRDPKGVPLAAISVAATSERLNASFIGSALPLVKRAVAGIERSMKPKA